MASRLAALDLTKDATVTCYTPLSSEDEDELDDAFEEIYPSPGAPVFFVLWKRFMRHRRLLRYWFKGPIGSIDEYL